MPSIVDPVSARNGAATVTRNLIRTLQAPPINAFVDCIPVPASRGAAHHLVRQSAAVARGMLNPIPVKPAFTYSANFRNEVCKRLEAQPDLVILNGSDLLWLSRYLPATMRCVLVVHNLEHQVFAAQASFATRRFPIIGPLIEREWRRLEHWEEEGIRRADSVIYLSQVDCGVAAPLNSNSIVIPPFFPDPPILRKTSADYPLVKVGFVGNLDWWPNRQGLQWFLSAVFPHVRTSIELHLIGQGTDALAIDDPHVIKHGKIASLEPVWGQCDLTICPIFHGGGVCIKLAEALHHGMPALATNFAARGLPVDSDPCLVLLDTAAEWSAFLASEGAMRLRTQRVASKLSQRFSASVYGPAIHQLLVGVPVPLH